MQARSINIFTIRRENLPMRTGGRGGGDGDGDGDGDESVTLL